MRIFTSGGGASERKDGRVRLERGISYPRADKSIDSLHRAGCRMGGAGTEQGERTSLSLIVRGDLRRGGIDLGAGASGQVWLMSFGCSDELERQGVPAASSEVCRGSSYWSHLSSMRKSSELPVVALTA
jgi:hypothetical protein